MARKRYSDEDCLRILGQVELDLAGGADDAAGRRRSVEEASVSGSIVDNHKLGIDFFSPPPQIDRE